MDPRSQTGKRRLKLLLAPFTMLRMVPFSRFAGEDPQRCCQSSPFTGERTAEAVEGATYPICCLHNRETRSRTAGQRLPVDKSIQFSPIFAAAVNSSVSFQALGSLAKDFFVPQHRPSGIISSPFWRDLVRTGYQAGRR